MPGQPASPTPPQRAQALQILAQTGIGKANYAPPLFRLLWRLQVNCPPPHFLPFWQAALLLGIFFGPSWVGLMWLLSGLLAWLQPSGLILSVAGLVIGALFGLSMALYYAYGRRKYRLPAWEALSSPLAAHKQA